MKRTEAYGRTHQFGNRSSVFACAYAKISCQRVENIGKAQTVVRNRSSAGCKLRYARRRLRCRGWIGAAPREIEPADCFGVVLQYVVGPAELQHHFEIQRIVLMRHLQILQCVF